jgi:hypothetical protein
MPKVMFYVNLSNLTYKENTLTVLLPPSIHDMLSRKLAVEEPEKYKFVFDVERKKKPRTTGERSQNHRINGHIQVICMENGEDFYFMKEWLKYKAIRRGYPFDTAPDGTVIPWSESRIDTVQAGYLCDEINQFAAERGIILPEYE